MGLGVGGVQEGRKTACKRLPVYLQLGKKIDTTEYTHPGSIIFAGTVLAWLCPLPLEARSIPAASVFTLEEFTRERNAAPRAECLQCASKHMGTGSPRHNAMALAPGHTGEVIFFSAISEVVASLKEVE